MTSALFTLLLIFFSTCKEGMFNTTHVTNKTKVLFTLLLIFSSNGKTSLPPSFYEHVLPFVNLMSLSTLSTHHHKSVLTLPSLHQLQTFWSVSHFHWSYGCYSQVLVSQFSAMFQSSELLEHYTVIVQTWISLHKSSRSGVRVS